MLCNAKVFYLNILNMWLNIIPILAASTKPAPCMPVKVLHKKTLVESEVDIREWNHNWVKNDYSLLEIRDVGNLYFHEYVYYAGKLMGVYERTEYETFAVRCSYVYSFEPIADVSYR